MPLKSEPGQKTRLILFVFLFVLHPFAEGIEEMRNNIADQIISKRYGELPKSIDSLQRLAAKIKINPLTPYETLSLKFMTNDINFLTKPDSIEYVKSDEYYSRMSVSRDALVLNIGQEMKEYSQSALFKERLEVLETGQRAFLKILSKSLVDSTEVVNNYIKEAVGQIGDTILYNYASNTLWFSLERAWFGGFDIGGGGNVFVSGAEKTLSNTGHIDFGVYLCKKSLCGEFEFQIINARSKQDIIQNGYTFSRHAGPQILRTNYDIGLRMVDSKRINVTGYAGLTLNPFGIADKQIKDYNITEDLQGFSIGYNLGATVDFPFGNGLRTGPRELTFLGLRLRTYYTSLHEPKINGLSGGDLNWSIQLYFEGWSLKRGRYQSE